MADQSQQSTDINVSAQAPTDQTAANPTANPADTFLEGLIHDAGFDVSLPVVKEELMKDLRERLDSAMIAAALQQLTLEKLDEFNKLAATNPPFEEKLKFLETNISNLPQVFQKAMVDFYNDFVPPRAEKTTA